MEHTPVQSSRLKSIGYDIDQRKLEVLYKNGQLYRFKEVPPNFYTECLMAKSIGKYYFNNIKDSFPYEIFDTQIDEAEEED